jgi:pantoate--beta-alanine ligase
MGALHEGHIELIKNARKANDIVVVSIFVNPTQFLKGEDLDKYPKRDEADKKICELAEVDVLFFPQAKDMYGDDEVSLLAPKVRGYVLEGATRPGHFNGVLTVVMKLLNIVNPTRAYFGKKDAQQLNLITLMVKQLFMSVDIVAIDTVRESDGLALSSRNVYLNEKERVEALKISASLYEASKMVAKNILDTKEIKLKMREILSPLDIGYVEILNRDFEMIEKVEIGNSIVLVEAIVGDTRLLDNIWL